MFSRLFSVLEKSSSVPQQIYGGLVAQARLPHFFTAWQMPDTPTGRFELLSLHVFLFSQRLSREADRRAASLSQDVFDVFTAELDRALRELGVGDTSVAKRKKRMVAAFYAQIEHLAQPLEQGDVAALAERLQARVPDAPGEPEAAKGLARYLVAAHQALAAQSLDDIIEQGPAFPVPGSRA